MHRKVQSKNLLNAKPYPKKGTAYDITGDGGIARHYINLARNLGSDEASLDIMGIEVSRLNAKLLMVALKEMAYLQCQLTLKM